MSAKRPCAFIRKDRQVYASQEARTLKKDPYQQAGKGLTFGTCTSGTCGTLRLGEASLVRACFGLGLESPPPPPLPPPPPSK
eukprot:scaffold153462_cov16-Tisochrysis_lutea.AAC.1